MNRWPGRGECGGLNPLRLTKKSWIEAECIKFFKTQELTPTNDIRTICMNLFNAQKKIAKLSHADCNKMTKDYFCDNQEQTDMFESDHDMISEGDEENNEINDTESISGDIERTLFGEEIEVEYSESDDVTESSDDDETLDNKIKNMLAKTHIGDLLKDEDNIPMDIKQSKRYRNMKKDFVLSQFEGKDSQEIVTQLSQVPDSVSRILSQPNSTSTGVGA